MLNPIDLIPDQRTEVHLLDAAMAQIDLLRARLEKTRDAMAAMRARLVSDDGAPGEGGMARECDLDRRHEDLVGHLEAAMNAADHLWRIPVSGMPDAGPR